MQHRLRSIFSLKLVFMTELRQVKLSAKQRIGMWSRWKAGQSLHEIVRAFGKDRVSIQFMLSRRSGRPQDRASEADHQAWESAL